MGQGNGLIGGNFSEILVKNGENVSNVKKSKNEFKNYQSELEMVEIKKFLQNDSKFLFE